MNTNFTNIKIAEIHPHIDNPRKDLGDLTELAESIKARGILQNLTVVPGCKMSDEKWQELAAEYKKNPTEDLRNQMNRREDPDGYTVIIGHRRLAAAKLAGLTEVPCVVSDMDHRDQVATMLLENIQRSDLTPIEQAQGFQMMMNLGETVAGISEKTGFSDGTIRKRLALTKLDQKKLQESYARGGTLMDYAKLEQLKDEKTKNKILESIGTRDFDWNLKNAIDEQEKPARKEALLKVLSEFANKVKNTGEIKGGYSYEKYFGGFHMGEWKKPKDADKAEYYYTVENGGASLYKKIEKAVPKALSAKEKAFNKREAELKKLSKRAYEMRYEFIQNFNAGKKYSREIQYFAFQRLMRYGSPDQDKLFKIFNIESPDTNNMDWSTGQELRRSKILEKYSEAPENTILKTAYIGLNDSSGNDYFSARSWESKIVHDKNRDLDIIYDMLFSLGYAMSDEEKQLQDGSHELFDKPKEVEPKKDSVPDNVEDGLFYCTQDGCPFNDCDGGCQFDPADEDDEDYFQDMQEAILTYECQNPEVKTKYDELFEEMDESGEEIFDDTE